MAKLMPSLRRSHQSHSISNLFNTTKQNSSLFTSKLHNQKLLLGDNIRREIQYELQHSPSNQLNELAG
ncbi:hypothetical protein Q3G72_008263 [Acer saccharum]|nr:hypothetical protein Q3G72_008263 [Acer saccharum]